MLNFNIMRNPLNWAIVTAMVLIAAIAAHLAAGLISSTKES